MGWALCSIQLKNTMNGSFSWNSGRIEVWALSSEFEFLDFVSISVAIIEGTADKQLSYTSDNFSGEPEKTKDDGGDVPLTAVILTALCSVTIILLLIVCLLMGLRKMQAIQKLFYPSCSSNSSIVKCFLVMSVSTSVYSYIRQTDSQGVNKDIPKLAVRINFKTLNPLHTAMWIPDTCSNPAHQTTGRLVRSISTPAGFQNTSSTHLPRSTNHNWIPYVIQSIAQQNGQTYTALWPISSNQPITKPVAIRLVGVNGTDVQIGSRMGLVSRGIRTSNTIQASLGYPIHLWKGSLVFSNLLPSTSAAELKSDKNLTAPQKDFTPICREVVRGHYEDSMYIGWNPWKNAHDFFGRTQFGAESRRLISPNLLRQVDQTFECISSTIVGKL
ncbi:hypothetical protein CLF_100874 [Clonorchis sinensis]|uniref:Uncharacterized protein n=1 Tax=Clonorchis sinensis TaxID=79923 RepID=G7Y4G1_CLOSI|nr:hypothetical protein CLF_100874 [Clonorchis sinensis]